MKKIIILSLVILIPTLTFAGESIKLDSSEKLRKGDIKCFSERGKIIYVKNDVRIGMLYPYKIVKKGREIKIPIKIMEGCIVEYTE